MPVFIGDVLESCGGPILDLSGNKVKGIGRFDNTGARDTLGADFQSSGYVSIIDGSLEVYSGDDWADHTNWARIAQRFEDYDPIELENGTEANSTNYASQFISDTNEDEDRYSFGVWDFADKKFRRLGGGVLRSIIVHFFGQSLAENLSSTTGNNISFYTDSTSGLVGDLNGDGVVTVSDMLTMLGGFGANSETLSRDYSMNLGQQFWPVPSESQPLVGSKYDGSTLYSSDFESDFGLDSFGNNISVTSIDDLNEDPTQAGDDIIFSNLFVDGPYHSEPTITIKHQNADGSQANLVPFLISANGSVPTINVPNPVGTGVIPEQSSITFNHSTAADAVEVLEVTTSSGFTANPPIFFTMKISLVENGNVIPIVGGGNYLEINMGEVVSTPQEAAGTFSYMSDSLPSHNLINDINAAWGLNLNSSVVHEIRFTPQIEDNNYLQFIFPQYGTSQSFTIKDFRIRVVGGNSVG